MQNRKRRTLLPISTRTASNLTTSSLSGDKRQRAVFLRQTRQAPGPSASTFPEDVLHRESPRLSPDLTWQTTVLRRAAEARGRPDQISPWDLSARQCQQEFLRRN